MILLFFILATLVSIIAGMIVHIYYKLAELEDKINSIFYKLQQGPFVNPSTSIYQAWKIPEQKNKDD